jgi:hypothetical protein
MIIEQIPNDNRLKLQLAIDKCTKSYAKRGVSFIINAESEYVGSLTLIVTGKKGSVQKPFSIIFNQASQEWEAYSEGYVYKMTSLSEIGILIRSKTQKLTTILSKI